MQSQWLMCIVLASKHPLELILCVSIWFGEGNALHHGHAPHPPPLPQTILVGRPMEARHFCAVLPLSHEGVAHRFGTKNRALVPVMVLMCGARIILKESR